MNIDLKQGRWVGKNELKEGDIILFARWPGSKSTPTRWHKNPVVGSPNYSLSSLRGRGLEFFVAIIGENEFGPVVP